MIGMIVSRKRVKFVCHNIFATHVFHTNHILTANEAQKNHTDHSIAIAKRQICVFCGRFTATYFKNRFLTFFLMYLKCCAEAECEMIYCYGTLSKLAP